MHAITVAVATADVRDSLGALDEGLARDRSDDGRKRSEDPHDLIHASHAALQQLKSGKQQPIQNDCSTYKQKDNDTRKRTQRTTLRAPLLLSRLASRAERMMKRTTWINARIREPKHIEPKLFVNASLKAVVDGHASGGEAS